MTATYTLCGLVVRCPLPLDARPSHRPDADLTVEVAGGRPIPSRTPAGRVWSRLAVGPLRSYVTRRTDGFRLRVAGVVDADLDPTLTHARLWIDPARDDGFAGLIVAGGLLAAVLALRGRPALHASAVVRGEAGVAIVAPSGGGKSTLAGLLAATGGGALLTDDLLSWDAGGDGPPVGRCGATGLRLRDPTLARTLADRCGWPSRQGPDGRTVLYPGSVDAAPLAAVLLPRRGEPRWALRRLRGSTAAAAVGLHPRTAGWVAPAVWASHLQHLADLVRRVPVWEVALPAGPPTVALGTRIWEALAAEEVTPRRPRPRHPRRRHRLALPPRAPA